MVAILMCPAMVRFMVRGMGDVGGGSKGRRRRDVRIGNTNRRTEEHPMHIATRTLGIVQPLIITLSGSPRQWEAGCRERA